MWNGRRRHLTSRSPSPSHHTGHTCFQFAFPSASFISSFITLSVDIAASDYGLLSTCCYQSEVPFKKDLNRVKAAAGL